jgi:hypothetical protein
MASLFEGASAGTLRALADGFRSGRLGVTASKLTLNRIAQCPESLVQEVTRLLAEGMTPAHMALLLDARADAVNAHGGAPPIELVWTGPETFVSYSRDTSVVVRELFESAQRSVLVSTFVVRQGRTVFAPLAARMDAVPGLRVQLFLHVGRKDKWDTRHESELLREFTDAFRKDWPGRRHPEVYYDTRALDLDGSQRATWHAKCVLVDDDAAFVTSANFTEWAHLRNVEAGVLIRDCHFTAQLKAQFDGLVQAKQVTRLPGF